MRISQPGVAMKRRSVLRSERCSRKSAVFSTMRGAVHHQRMGSPRLYHGKMPRR